MAVERAGAVTMGGAPKTLVGPELRVGDRAPDFVATAGNLAPWRFLDETRGRARLLNVVPSIDTGVCNQQSRRFDQEVRDLPSVTAVTVSMDLPFAQSRWQAEAHADHLTMVSDHVSASFGQAYGTLIKDLRLECRAVFVVDRDGVVRYAQYVPEVTTHPDYDGALAALRALL